MITPYYGEVMTNPIPLELSFHDCSYACRYCFAQKRGLPFKWQAFVNTLKTMDERNTLTKYLLSERFPVLMSNRSDPFCHSNYELTVKICDMLLTFEIPISFQTKGFCNSENEYKPFIKQLPKSCWYITIAFDNETLREKFEPGAPTIKSRFRLIEILKEHGHNVVVGINPLTEEWADGKHFEGIKSLLNKLKSHEVSGVWIELLHFNKNFIGRMSKNDINTFTPRFIKKYLYRKYSFDDKVYQFFLKCKELVHEYGMESYGGVRFMRTEYWKPFYETYPKLYPVWQNFYNWCYDNKNSSDEVSFDEFVEHSGGIILPDSFKTSQFKSFIAANSIGLLQKCNFPSKMSMIELLKVNWARSELRTSLTLSPQFHFIDKNDNKNFPLLAFFKN